MTNRNRWMAVVSLIVMLAVAGSCAKEEIAIETSVKEIVAQKQVPVTFGTYKASAASTRAGSPGVINTDADLRTKGFGVFAYYTEATTFDEVPVATRSLIPDFMYNEHIVWKAASSEWTYYDPNDTKYWPNDFSQGPVDNRGTEAAQGSKVNYISFFAYAPYAGTLTQNNNSSKTGATSSANEGTASGIIAVSGNQFNGDPFLTYRLANTSDKMVDLLWGTAGGAANGDSATGQSQPGGSVTRSVDNGQVMAVTAVDSTNINMTKQVTSGKVTFNFKHALSKVGGSATGSTSGLTVDLVIDDVAGITHVKQATTKVTVKSIQVTHNDAKTGGVLTNPMPSTGTFNLATGIWAVTVPNTADANTYLALNHLIDQTGTQGISLAADIREPVTFNSWADLNGIAGVEESPAKNVYAADTAPLLFLPGTTPSLKFTIEYVVRTKDDKLAKGYTEVWQKITKTVTFAAPVQQNKQYNIAIHIGLTTVKFNASVSNWGDGATTAVDMPINVN